MCRARISRDDRHHHRTVLRIARRQRKPLNLLRQRGRDPARIGHQDGRCIGGQIAQNGYDSVTTRARTSKAQKIGWLMQSATRAGISTVSPRSAVLYAKPLPEVAFLVEAAGDPNQSWDRADGLIETLSQLAATDRLRRNDLIARRARLT